MGCVHSYIASSRSKKRTRELEVAAKNRNDALSEQLKAEWRKIREERVILAFEYGESGKSTVLDQMKRMESNATILEALPQLKLTLPPDLGAAATIIVSLPRVNRAITQEMTQALRSLWHNPIIKEASRGGHEFSLDHNASYYLESIERISEPNYQPTREDIVRCKVGLTGVMEMSFSAQEFRFKVCDMGPQIGDPVSRKYIRGFTGVHTVMFFINLCDYCQYDKVGLFQPSRMDDAMKVYGSICDSIWFCDSDIIVFFTHKDEFDRKLVTSPLGDHFRDYSGGNDPGEASQHILNWFKKLDNYRDVRRRMLTYFISANDSPEKLNAFLVDYFTPRWAGV
ncbi:G-protein alpha subunit-domain-containing protein [Collybia nuda]|uniref:G-protein alpha subunit-domain-containing protein n=1 Tax=Collybia nuda TaxID=64659 RepID=A0A9P5Y7P2_9AGAR|nr:G-protein alpha subunit-domain-containing protein [Collybia nuda]